MATTQKTAEKTAEKANAEAQKNVDQAEELGFIGTKVDPLPNERYSLESGPDSPSARESRRALLDAEADR